MRAITFSRQSTGYPMTPLVCAVFILAMLLTAISNSSDIETPSDEAESYGFGNVDLLRLSDADKQYLGLADGDKPILINIKADLIIVEFMSIYCPGCQMQASIFNQLHSAVDEDTTLRSKVKMIAIGVGNNQREVSHFKNTQEVVFPILPDPKFAIYERLADRMKAPYTVLLRKGKNGDLILVSSHRGLIKSYESFLQEIKAAMQYDEDILRLKQGERPIHDVAEINELSLSDEELMAKLRRTIIRAAGDKNADPAIKTVPLPGNTMVYEATVCSDDGQLTYFAIVVSRESICDICHDIQFIYVLDETGKFTELEPIQLTKYENGNAMWNEDDVERMRQRILGKSILQPMDFNPEVDAITSATITSAVMFHALEQGKGIFQSVVKMR